MVSRAVPVHSGPLFVRIDEYNRENPEQMTAGTADSCQMIESDTYGCLRISPIFPILRTCLKTTFEYS